MNVDYNREIKFIRLIGYAIGSLHGLSFYDMSEDLKKKMEDTIEYLDSELDKIMNEEKK